MKRIAPMALAVLWIAAPALAGAPAWFEVRGAEVSVRRTGDSAEARVVYDLAVRDAACGWFCAEVAGLPSGKDAPRAALAIDGKEYPLALAQDRSGTPVLSAWRDADRDEGVKALTEAKSVRLVLSFPKAACAGPEFPFPVLLPRPEYREEEPRNELPRLSVRFDAESDGTTAEVRVTFRSVARGSRLVLRSDALSAGVSVAK